MIEYIGNNYVVVKINLDNETLIGPREIRTYGIIVSETEHNFVISYYNPLPPNNLITQIFAK